MQLCDVVCQFYSSCGHSITYTSCHNTENPNRVQQVSPGADNATLGNRPCNENLCDQSAVFTRYNEDNCMDCRHDDGFYDNLRFDRFYNGVTVIRSDPHMDEIPQDELESR